MDIRRTRVRSSTLCNAPDYTSLLAQPFVHYITGGNPFWTLCIRSGVHINALKSVSAIGQDQLDEGFRVYEIAHRWRWPFSPLRRTASVPSKTGNTLDTGVSTSNARTVKVTTHDYSAIESLLVARGYTRNSTYWYKDFYGQGESQDEVNARSECQTLNTSLQGMVTPPAQTLENRYVSCYWSSGAKTSLSIPQVVLKPDLPTLPEEMQQGSSAMRNARFDAWQSLQSGGSMNKSLNKLQAVLELKDAPRTGTQVLEFVSFCKHMEVSNPKWLLQASLTQLAGGYLLWKFGIVPTVADANQWLKENIQRKAIAEIGLAKEPLAVGDTIRCAYGIEPVNPHNGPGVITWTTTTNHSIVETGSTVNYILDPLKDLVWNNLFYPADCAVPVWSHKGLMFSRALAPGMEMMPDWFWDLFPDFAVGEIIQPLSATRRALVMNPPIDTLWALTGWTWLLGWFVNTNKLVSRISRAVTRLHITCTFVKLWVCDRWTVKPRWPKPLLVYSPVADVVSSLTATFARSTFISGSYRRYTVRVNHYPTTTCTVTTKWMLSTTPCHPLGGIEQLMVVRDEVPQPQIPGLQIKVSLDAAKVVTLAALSLTRVMSLLKGARLSAKMTRQLLRNRGLSAARYDALMKHGVNWITDKSLMKSQ